MLCLVGILSTLIVEDISQTLVSKAKSTVRTYKVPTHDHTSLSTRLLSGRRENSAITENEGWNVGLSLDSDGFRKLSLVAPLFLCLSFHSFIAGISLGVQDEKHIWGPILIAIVAHKGLDSYEYI